MKAGPFCLLLAFGAVFGSGCVSQSVDAENVLADTCQVLDYGIEEFKLISSLPIVSENYEFLVRVEQIGDCKADALTVSLYEGGVLNSQYNISDPKTKEVVSINWVPSKDSEVNFRAELELMDQDNSNNSEFLKINVLPVGNYLYISDLTGDLVEQNKFIAEAIDLRTNIKTNNLELFLRGTNEDSAAAEVIIELRTDDNGRPGSLVMSKNSELALNAEYNWYTLSIDKSLNPGKYWLVLGSANRNFLWHYSRREAGGALMETKKPEYLLNQTSLRLVNGTWEPVPEKDYTFKLHSN